MLNIKTILLFLIAIAAYFMMPELFQVVGVEITMYIMALAVAALIAGLVIKTYRRNWLFITDKASTVIFRLTGGILLLYLVDLLLLIGFGIPVSIIHEGSVAGTVFSIIVICIVVLNLARDYTNLQQVKEEKQNGRGDLYYVFAFSVSAFWLFVELTGLMLKIMI